jgi:hypothetical protein
MGIPSSSSNRLADFVQRGAARFVIRSVVLVIDNRHGGTTQRPATDTPVDAGGTGAINTLRFTASGAAFAIGQNLNARYLRPRMLFESLLK